MTIAAIKGYSVIPFWGQDSSTCETPWYKAKGERFPPIGGYSAIGDMGTWKTQPGPKGKGGKSVKENAPADLSSEKNKRGWKTQGRGKHTIKPLPKNGFGPPHLWYVSPPPRLFSNFRPVVFLKGNQHRPGKSHFLRPRKLVLESALYGTFSPPPKSHDMFCPPISRFPISVPVLFHRSAASVWDLEAP